MPLSGTLNCPYYKRVPTRKHDIDHLKSCNRKRVEAEAERLWTEWATQASRQPCPWELARKVTPCGAKFPDDMSGLVRHVNNHVGHAKSQCRMSACRLIFPSTIDMASHVESIHGRPAGYSAHAWFQWCGFGETHVLHRHGSPEQNQPHEGHLSQALEWAKEYDY